MQNISIEAAKAKGFISGYRVGRIILACSIERWKYGKLLKELREDCTNIFKFHTGRRTRYYYDPFEVLEKIKGYKQYGNRHLSKEKIDEYCNSVKEAKEKRYSIFNIRSNNIYITIKIHSTTICILIYSN